MVIVHVYCSDLNPKWQKQEAPKCENGILCHADIFCVALTVLSIKGVKMGPTPKLLNSYYKSDFEVYFP